MGGVQDASSIWVVGTRQRRGKRRDAPGEVSAQRGKTLRTLLSFGPSPASRPEALGAQAWRRTRNVALGALLLTGCAGPAVGWAADAAVQIYVDPVQGRDGADGYSAGTALRTLEAAKAKAGRAARRGQDVVVNLRGGAYRLKKTLSFTPADGAVQGRTVTYRPFSKDEHPIISGGVDLTGQWSDPDGDGVFEASVPKGTISRNLYIDGAPAVLARSDGAPFKHIVITETGFVADDSPIADFKNPEQVEFAWAGSWKWKVFSAASITRREGKTVVTIKAPGWSLRSGGWDSIENPDYPIKTVLTPLPALVQNARELLDAPGEWYLNTQLGKVFYKPAEGVDIRHANAVLGLVENTLVRVTGQSGRPVRGLRFEGLSFQNATYLRPGQPLGHAGNQSNATKEKPGTNEVGPTAASVEVRYGHDVWFVDSDFRNSGSGGLFFDKGSHGGGVTGSTFTQLGSNAVQIGDFRRTTDDDDSCIGCTTRSAPDRVRDLSVTNNYIHHIGLEAPTAAQAIHVAWAEQVRIEHNEIHDLGYTGIALGYRWSESPGPYGDNRVIANRIYDYLKAGRDGGGIYTVGDQKGSGEGTRIAENYVFAQHDDFGGLYPDEGSSHEVWERNVVENMGLHRWLHDNSVGKSSRQIGLVFRDNYADTTRVGDLGLQRRQNTTFYSPGDRPAEAQRIVDAAGLEPAYRDLLTAQPALQAEYASTSAPTLTAQPGYNGGGYVTLSAAQSAGFTIDGGLGGAVSAHLRHANLKPTTVTVENEGAVQVMDLPPTGGAWMRTALSLTLKRGLNRVTVRSQKGAPLIDEIDFADIKAINGPYDLALNAGSLARPSTLQAAPGWNHVERLLTDTDRDGLADYLGAEASLTFELPHEYDNLVFALREPNTGQDQIAAWQVQYADDAGAWIDAMPWIESNTDLVQTYKVRSHWKGRKLRLLVKNPGGRGALWSFAAFGALSEAAQRK